MCKLCRVKNRDIAEGGALQCQQMRCWRGGGIPLEISKNEMQKMRCPRGGLHLFVLTSTKARSYTCKFSVRIWKDLLACYNWLGAMALSGSSNRRHHYWSSSCWILQVYLFKLCCPLHMYKLCLVKNWDIAEGGALQCQQRRCCRGGVPQEMSKNEMLQKGGRRSTTSKNETAQRGVAEEGCCSVTSKNEM